jgi:hypothetical protein
VCTKVVVDGCNEMVHGDEESKEPTRDSLLKGGPINEAAVPLTFNKTDNYLATVQYPFHSILLYITA